MLRRRAEIIQSVREFFVERGFLEVETPLLSRDVTVERGLNPWTARPFDGGQSSGTGASWWLQTSPEFALKRLMAAGGEAIFEITRAFRGDEFGNLHNPEFTLLEWYRRGDAMDDGMRLLDELSSFVLKRGGAEMFSYAEVFIERVGIDPHRVEAKELSNAAKVYNVSAPESMPDDDLDGWLSLLFAELVEPQLGRQRPAIIHGFPACQAALATIVREDQENIRSVASRFELYVDGIELANGYHELRDVDELQARFEAINDLRQKDGKSPLPERSRLIPAMEQGLPHCTGVAVGLDRLIMIALGASNLREVIAFPADRA